MLIQDNIPLAPFTSLKIGGPARFFAQVATEREAIDALDAAHERGVPVFILGGGSNLLVSDAGFDGMVVHLMPTGIKRDVMSDGRVHVTAAAGEEWDAFVRFCVAAGLAGVENLSGIPGLVGGTPVQNVGAYGQEVSDTIVSVRCLDRAKNEIVELDSDRCGFSYRTSIFNTTERDRYVVLGVTFALVPGGEPKLSYKDLRIHFGQAKPTLQGVRDAVLSIRRSKSMVIDEDDPNRMSAGSFFKNPVVSTDIFEELERANGQVPFFPFDGRVKVPAAWLIERAGFQKGFRLGNAGISSNHTLALINCGGATAAEVIALKDLIQQRVFDAFGIELTPEPVFVGF